MATISVPSILEGKKYTFIFILVTFILLVSSFTRRGPFSSDPEIQRASIHLGISPNCSGANTGTVDNDDDDNLAVDVEWELCDGPVAVDYISCLDNMKAIKAFRSHRHTEHRERHCPDPVPRCLVPMPQGYNAPIPWPKSRDMVRSLIL